MPIKFNAPRPFSATTPVYPSYLPALHKAGRIERKIATATIAAVGIGYGLAKYRAAKADKWQQEHNVQKEQLFRSAETIPATVPIPVPTAETSWNEVVENAYGDRTSLKELEAAIAVYEKRQKN
ncbi:hypothetical protein F5Y00DRAFT_266597 [Daldinia vernicosa]|uniref:uncharacterized protein n=1 Tax=Daldinia vernicosa TaxID=114800 RepID=UPI0020082C90|nr:uncharacterized protein F5Y00DRAFT_266597 [Daldinia vernicosa]KAI0844439.1 hypothetical protein F5Y00DRAFT_266597 [Daldinia vernicosa]